MTAATHDSRAKRVLTLYICKWMTSFIICTMRTCTCMQMISAERLLAYGNLHPEASLETPPGVQKPPKSWPSQGGIRLLRMKFRYAADTPYVLKDVSVDIQPREKVCVLGYAVYQCNVV